MTLGATLLLVNVVGVLTSALRVPDVDQYVDFAGVATKDAGVALAELESFRAQPLPQRLVNVTETVHEAIAHVDPDDRARIGNRVLRMRVPFLENYLLFALSYVKPDTYADYEFCSFRRAIRRGIGRCGQQALAVVDYLARDGVETGFVYLGGHTVATAHVPGQGWFLLDPDFGAVIPFGLDYAQTDPAATLQYYWSDAATSRAVWKLYAPEQNRIKYGGPDARWSRACDIERLAYILKWLIPALLLLFGLFWGYASSSNRKFQRG